MSDDARDERLGRMLEVEPLDDVSRRRLVRTAMQASEPRTASRRTWRLVAAASLVAVVVAGGATYLATRDTSTTNPTALADRNAAGDTGAASVAPSPAAPGSGEGNPQAAEPRPLEASGKVTDLGDFGDLDTIAELNRVRSAFSAAAAAGATSAQSSTAADSSTRVASLLSELRAQPCAGGLPEGTIVALGRARFGTRDAIVVKTELTDGSDSTDAVVADPCEVRPLD